MTVMDPGEDDDRDEEGRDRDQLDEIRFAEAVLQIGREKHDVAGDMRRHQVAEADERGDIDPTADEGEQDPEEPRDFHGCVAQVFVNEAVASHGRRIALTPP